MMLSKSSPPVQSLQLERGRFLLHHEVDILPVLENLDEFDNVGVVQLLHDVQLHHKLVRVGQVRLFDDLDGPLHLGGFVDPFEYNPEVSSPNDLA